MVQFGAKLESAKRGKWIAHYAGEDAASHVQRNIGKRTNPVFLRRHPQTTIGSRRCSRWRPSRAESPPSATRRRRRRVGRRCARVGGRRIDRSAERYAFPDVYEKLEARKKATSWWKVRLREGRLRFACVLEKRATATLDLEVVQAAATLARRRRMWG